MRPANYDTIEYKSHFSFDFLEKSNFNTILMVASSSCVIDLIIVENILENIF